LEYLNINVLGLDMTLKNYLYLPSADRVEYMGINLDRWWNKVDGDVGKSFSWWGRFFCCIWKENSYN